MKILCHLVLCSVQRLSVESCGGSHLAVSHGMAQRCRRAVAISSDHLQLFSLRAVPRLVIAKGRDSSKL
jgi:hypothetical protein